MWFAGWAMFSRHLGLESVLFCELEIFSLLIPQKDLFLGFMLSPLKFFFYDLSGKCVISSMYLSMEHAAFHLSDMKSFSWHLWEVCYVFYVLMHGICSISFIWHTCLQPHKCFLNQKMCPVQGCMTPSKGWDGLLAVCITDKIPQGECHCVNRVVVVFNVFRNS